MAASLLVRLLAAIMFLQAAPPTSPANPPASAPAGAPTGPAEIVVTPPTNALRRTQPRQYDLTFTVNLATLIPPGDAGMRELINVVDAPIVMPLIIRGSYSAIDRSTINASLFIDGRPDPGLMRRTRIVDARAYGMALGVMPVARATCQSLKWQISWRMQVWDCEIDLAGAARATWPREWPAEAQAGLQPQLYIESNDPIFAQFVQEVSGGQLRTVPPFYAAKDIIRASTNRIRTTMGGIQGGVGGTMYGMVVNGAAWSLRNGEGSPHDVVCVCVAALRAAGIPARPVIGVNRNKLEQYPSSLISWGEFYLPDSGWVPFDPAILRGNGSFRKRVDESWNGLGPIDDLNNRLSLSYFYHPPADVIAHLYPAIWGWDPRPNGAPGSLLQYVDVSAVSRGAGRE